MFHFAFPAWEALSYLWEMCASEKRESPKRQQFSLGFPLTNKRSEIPSLPLLLAPVRRELGRSQSFLEGPPVCQPFGGRVPQASRNDTSSIRLGNPWVTVAPVRSEPRTSAPTVARWACQRSNSHSGLPTRDRLLCSSSSLLCVFFVCAGFLVHVQIQRRRGSKVCACRMKL